MQDEQSASTPNDPPRTVSGDAQAVSYEGGSSGGGGGGGFALLLFALSDLRNLIKL